MKNMETAIAKFVKSACRSWPEFYNFGNTSWQSFPDSHFDLDSQK